MKLFILAFVISLSLPALSQMRSGRVVYDKESLKRDDSSYIRSKTFVVNFSGSIFYETLEFDSKAFDFTKPMKSATGEFLPPLSAEEVAMHQLIRKKTLYAPKVFDYEKRKLIYQTQYANQYLAIADSLLFPTVIFTQDTATIESIFCQKAISIDPSHDWEFWYAPSIPTVAGPEGISNFPGLLILARSLSTKVRFRLVSLEYPSKTEFRMPYENRRLYNKSEFEKIVKEIDTAIANGKPVENY
jgi:GLPGLI family protein